MIRFVLKLSLLLVLPLAVAALLLGLALSSTPWVQPVARVSMADMERGRQLWHDLGLGGLQEGQVRRLRLSPRDLDLGLGYLAHRLRLEGVKSFLTEDALRLQASWRLPVGAHPLYLNFEVTLRPAGERFDLAGLRIGRLSLPSAWAARLLTWGLSRVPLLSQYAVVVHMLHPVQWGPQELVLDVVWHGRALDMALARSAGLDVETLEVYRQELARHPAGSLAPLLGQAFALAKLRAEGGDPVAENRAALAALTERALGRHILSVRGVQAGLGAAAVTLQGREDFAQHFTVSAFLAAVAGEEMADAAGLYKELQDSLGGSGFSFNDLAADRAGSRLGEDCTRSPMHARRMQGLLAGVREEGVFFPRVDDLPEFMSQAEFRRRFGGVGAPAYQALVKNIEERIAALDIYRQDHLSSAQQAGQ